MSSIATPRVAFEVLESLEITADHSGAYCGRWLSTQGPSIVSTNPSNGEPLGSVRAASAEDYEEVAAASVAAFEAWRTWPAPRRGEVVRQLAEELRQA